MLIGLLCFVIGLFFYIPALRKFNFLGQLPGDIKIEGKNSSFYFPLASSLIISAILSLLAYLFRK